MDLTRELLLPYQGLNGIDGLCHVRIYEQAGQLPVVIAGGLDDNPGTSITNAIEMVAAAVQRSEFSEGREFRLIEHYPDTVDRQGTPTYSLIGFKHRSINERPDDPGNYAGTIVIVGEQETAVSRGAEIEGDFRNPSWEPPTDSVEELLGCEVTVWEPGTYTARAIGGEPGGRLRSELAANATSRANAIADLLEDDS